MTLFPNSFCLFAALASIGLGAARAGGMGERFVSETRIQVIVPHRAADVVVLTGGYAAGLRNGQVCDVIRNGSAVGEVLVTDLRISSSTALILRLDERFVLQVGDTVRARVHNS